MLEIVDFLSARYDEDEAAAKAAPGSQWQAHTEGDIAGASVYDEQWVLLYPERYGHDHPLSSKPGATGPQYINERRDELAAHIARHDPARVLREVKAGRYILARYQDCLARMEDDDYPQAVARDQAREYEDFVLPNLAAVFSDHPDYKEEWRP